MELREFKDCSVFDKLRVLRHGIKEYSDHGFLAVLDIVFICGLATFSTSGVRGLFVDLLALGAHSRGHLLQKTMQTYKCALVEQECGAHERSMNIG